MQLLVDQLGYAPDAPRRAILQGSPDTDPGPVEVQDAESGRVVTTIAPERVGHVEDWKDWEYWTVDLSAVDPGGEYVLAVEDGDGERARSRRFEIGEDLLLEEPVSDVVRYFRAERCTGIYDRADREAPFVGDREDTVDVSGGWYDASGDVSKYLSHLSYANYWNPQQIPLVVWSLLEARDLVSPIQAGRVDGSMTMEDSVGFDALEEARYGADYLVRCQDDAGYFYMTVFDQWSSDPDEREVCAYEGFGGTKTDGYEAGFRQGGGMAIAALARASRLDAGGEFTTATYMETAVEGFDHLSQHNEAYLDDGTENLLDDYTALLAATELAAAARDGDGVDAERFEAAADDRVRSILERQTDDGWFRVADGDRPFFHASDEGLPIVALCRYLEVLEDPAAAADVRVGLREYWEWQTSLTDDVVNPFGYARQYAMSADEDEPSGRFFVPHENETGYWWQGENARLGSMAAAAHRTRAVLDDDGLADRPDDDGLTDRLDAFARDQLHWLLGRNPYDTCMVEGVGNDPVPFIEGIPNTPGGLVNGVTAGVDDESDIAFMPPAYADEGEYNWRWTEQWIPHAAWFLVAATWQGRGD